MCPAAYYCIEGTEQPRPCPTGHYCPEGTPHATDFPCPNGTYSNVTMLEAAADCAPCLPGSYCGSPGLTVPEGPCGPGHFCLAGASAPIPLRAAFGGPCHGGYACVSGASSPAPVDGVTGYACPRGHFCVNGSAHEVRIDSRASAATVNSRTIDLYHDEIKRTCDRDEAKQPHASSSRPRRENVSRFTRVAATGAKRQRIARRWADDLSLPFHAPYHHPILACRPRAPRALVGRCPPQVGCPPGTYQPSDARASCVTCPAGGVCPGNNTLWKDCPLGYYCPAGSAVGTFCPAGTFGNGTVALTAADECAYCPSTQYCADGTVTGDCSAGYFCRTRAGEATPPTSAAGLEVGLSIE